MTVDPPHQLPSLERRLENRFPEIVRPIDTWCPMTSELRLANKTYERSYCENERFVILLVEFEQ